MKNFVGEIVSERFSVLRHKFAKEIMERRNKLLKIKSRLSQEGGQIYFVRNSGQWGELLGFICPKFLTINRFSF